MELHEVLTTLLRLFLGAVATFFAILLWSRTRDLAWILVVIGVLVGYVDTVYTTLEEFGIVGMDFVRVGGVAIFPVVLANVPLVFYIAAFAVMISRKRYR